MVVDESNAVESQEAPPPESPADDAVVDVPESASMTAENVEVSEVVDEVPLDNVEEDLAIAESLDVETSSSAAVGEGVGEVDSEAQFTERAPVAPIEGQDEDEEEDDDEDVEPLELIEEEDEPDEDISKDWYILKVQVNRESSICDALQRNVMREGLERYFDDILVPTEDVREFTKSGKQRVVKRKLFPGYILVHMAINDNTWFLVRETTGIGDFTGAAGKPTPMLPHEIEKILKKSRPPEDDEERQIVSVIKFKEGDRVRVTDGTFQNLEGEVDTIDESRGRIVVMLSVFNRRTPVELEHWQVEDV